MLALVAHWDTPPVGGEEVVGSIPAGSDNILSWGLMKYFLRSLPSAD